VVERAWSMTGNAFAMLQKSEEKMTNDYSRARSVISNVCHKQKENYYQKF